MTQPPPELINIRVKITFTQANHQLYQEINIPIQKSISLTDAEAALTSVMETTLTSTTTY